MYRFFLALVCAATVFSGCAPLRQFQCRGGASEATEYHVIEATSLDAARNGGEFGECRSAAAIERVVGDEYAGAQTQRCAAMIAYRVRWKEEAHKGFEGLEVFRGTGPSMIDASLDAWMGMGPWHHKYRSKYVSYEEVATGGRKSDETAPAHIVRCWHGDTVPDDVRDWPSEASYTFSAYDRWRGTSWFQTHPNGEVFDHGANCLDWNDGWRWRPATNHYHFQSCGVEMHGFEQIKTSDGWERGSSFVLVKFNANLCAPETSARSAVEASLRDRAPANWQLTKYIGKCWKTREAKPAAPEGWSGTEPW